MKSILTSLFSSLFSSVLTFFKQKREEEQKIRYGAKLTENKALRVELEKVKYAKQKERDARKLSADDITKRMRELRSKSN